MVLKKATTKNTKTQIIAAIRKIWRNHPLKKSCLDAACVDLKAKTYERKYICAKCKKSFLAQSVDVDHITPAPKNESVDSFIKRIFCDIKSYKGDTCILNSGENTTIKMQAAFYLRVLCKNCHKEITKKQNSIRVKK